MNKRHAGTELLRIVSILMICTLHYLNKGEILGNFNEAYSAPTLIAWLLDAFCLVSGDVFIMITGYYSGSGELKLKKILSFFGMVEFYSVGIYLLTILLKMRDFDLNDLLFFMCPISSEHYWFVSLYFVLLLMTPLLGKGLTLLNDKQFKLVFYSFIVLTCLVPSFVPIKLELTDKGYSIVWFITLYLTGAYIKRSSLEKLKKSTALLIYFMGCTLTFFSAVIIRFISRRTGRFEEITTHLYCYNSILIYLASIGLFVFFVKLEIKEGGMARFIRWAASSVFGIYLLHEHLVWRYEWPKWFHVSDYAGDIRFILHWLICILILSVAGILAEELRKLIFNGIGKLCRLKKKQ